jgi:hypothetical protein
MRPADHAWYEFWSAATLVATDPAAAAARMQVSFASLAHAMPAGNPRVHEARMALVEAWLAANDAAQAGPELERAANELAQLGRSDDPQLVRLRARASFLQHP